jgi:hypothetical protein
MRKKKFLNYETWNLKNGGDVKKNEDFTLL